MLGERYDAKVDLWSVGVILYGKHNVTHTFTYINLCHYFLCLKRHCLEKLPLHQELSLNLSLKFEIQILL